NPVNTCCTWSPTIFREKAAAGSSAAGLTVTCGSPSSREPLMLLPRRWRRLQGVFDKAAVLDIGSHSHGARRHHNFGDVPPIDPIAARYIVDDLAAERKRSNQDDA